ncbi:hypothetical protein N9053_00650 [bacterium]|nr:hypothetical protein [bacterium]
MKHPDLCFTTNCVKANASTNIVALVFIQRVCIKWATFGLAVLLSWAMVHGEVCASELPDGASHVIAFPKPLRGAARSRVGFSVSVGFTDLSSVGYQPVEIVFKSPVATRADLRLSYRIVSHAETQTPDDNRLSIDLPIVVPEGTKTATWVRYLPKWMLGNGYEVVVSQDGEPLPGFQGTVGVTPWYTDLDQYFGWRHQALDELRCNLLLITPEAELNSVDADALSSRGFATTVPWKGQGDVKKRSRFSNSMKFQAVAFACGSGSLPRDWRGYQRWDLIVLGKAAITKVKQVESEWNALCGWGLCGGAIAVWDVESQAELEALFDRPATDSRGPSLEQVESLGITQEDLNRVGIFNLRSTTVAPPGVASPRVASGKVASGKRDEKLSDGGISFYGFQLGAGKVIAVNGIPPRDAAVVTVAEADGVNEASLRNSPNWEFYSKLMEKDVSPVLRRGADPVLGNSEYKKWLVPGVAQPPVYVLVTLLTIFVILVGPVAYRRTKKSGRSHLMFVIAPVLALVTTVSMFAYGVAADGFSAIGRVRQITWVDGATGSAGERVRGTYFAPISPRAGLTFPGDSEVFAVRRPDSTSWEARHRLLKEPLGSVTVTQGMQRFSSSFLPSREQKQFVSQRPRLDVGCLTIKIAASKGQQCEVKNGFGFRVNDAIVRDRKGRYWRIKNLESGDSQIALELTSSAAAPVLGKYYLDYNPVAISGSRGGSNSSWRRTGTHDFTAELNRLLMVQRFGTEGRFEYWLRQTLQVSGDLPFGSFVALCDVTQDASAVAGCSLENSVRYVLGTLP